MPEQRTHYGVLGVSPDADTATIRAAYRRRVRLTHPDAGGSDAEFAAVSLAWAVLSSPERRKLYDSGLDGTTIGWGDEVDLDWGDVPEPAPAPVPSPMPAPDSGRDRTGRGGPAARRPIDPMTSPPRAIPPVSQILEDVREPSAYWPPRVTLAVGALILLPIALVIACAIGDVVVVGPGAWMSVGAFTGGLVWAVGLAGIAWDRCGGFPGSAWAPGLSPVWFWVWTGLFAVVGAASTALLEDPTAADRAKAILTVLVGTAVGVVVRALVERRVSDARADEEMIRAIRARHALAMAWNELLAGRERAGRSARVRHVVPRDPTRGSDSWVLVDGSGVRRASAPGGAPAAWVQLMRVLGVDVADAPSRR